MVSKLFTKIINTDLIIIFSIILGVVFLFPQYIIHSEVKKRKNSLLEHYYNQISSELGDPVKFLYLVHLIELIESTSDWPIDVKRFWQLVSVFLSPIITELILIGYRWTFLI